MSAEVLVAMVGVGGIILGGVLGLVGQAAMNRLAFRQERAWEIFRHERGRIEQLYVTVGRVHQTYSDIFAEVAVAVSAGRPITTEKLNSVPWARLQMLVDLYAPSMRPYYDDVRRAGQVLGAALGEAVVFPLPSVDARIQTIHGFSAPLDALGRAIERMQSELAAHSRQLADSAALVLPHPLLQRRKH